MGAIIVGSGKPLAAETLREADISFVHRELVPFATRIIEQSGPSMRVSSSTLETLRVTMDESSRPPSQRPPFYKKAIKRMSGGPDVNVFVINSEPGLRKPVIVHTHGGGFVVGSARGFIASLQAIAEAVDCVIVTVDYRLAPEVIFKGSTSDNYTALKWVHDNAVGLGVDRKRIAVMGESAGGGHAALLAIEARDRGEVPVMFQVLIYPMLDDRTGSVRQPAPTIGSLVWTAADNRFGWQSFLGQTPGTPTVPVAAVPARHKDLKGLPPAFIGVGTIDLFVDEDIEYARRLIDAGVATQLVTVPGAFHAFDGIAPDTTVAKRFEQDKLNALRFAFSSRY